MPRFYFHLEDHDEIGCELASLVEARREALKYLADSMTDSADNFWDRGNMRLEVENEDGALLFAIQVVGIDVLIGSPS
jgi:hypothetical protein